MSDDRAVLDTNVLLAATAPGRRGHRRALTVVNVWPNQGRRLCASGQILREYLVVATRPLEANGLGLAVADALDNLAALAGRMRLLAADDRVARGLRALVAETSPTGARIHDANLVATALTHGVGRIVTANVADFEPWADRLEIRDLAKVDAAAGA